MSLLTGLFVAVFIIVSYFLVFFFIGTTLKNNSIVDMGWGLGFVIPTLVLFFFTEQSDPQFLVMFFVSFWGFRLTYYLVKRNWHRKEDIRYKLWRRQWGDKSTFMAFQRVYLLQALIMIGVGLPVFLMMNETSNPLEFSLWSMPAIGIYFLGMAYEAIGDSQLKEHKKIEAKSLLTTGLWATTRHPNYVGNAMIWWGITLFIVIHQPALWWTLFSPLLMTLILRFISIPILERQLEKKPGWAEYKARTNAFIPWFTKERV